MANGTSKKAAAHGNRTSRSEAAKKAAETRLLRSIEVPGLYVEAEQPEEEVPTEVVESPVAQAVEGDDSE